MSLFSGLDGEVESLPTLIDEEDLLFGGETTLPPSGAPHTVETASLMLPTPFVLPHVSMR